MYSDINPVGFPPEASDPAAAMAPVTPLIGPRCCLNEKVE